MRLFNIPFLNWLVLNLITIYFIPIQSILNIDWMSWNSLVALAVFSGSLLWLLTSIGYFIYFKTSPNPMCEASYLITRGPFKFSRNPLYLTFCLFNLSFAIMTLSYYFLLSGFLFFLITHYYTIPKEEEYLKRSFKQQWLEYSHKTRPWL
nr:methyltransferase [uncultured Moellerella sp.]